MNDPRNGLNAAKIALEKAQLELSQALNYLRTQIPAMVKPEDADVYAASKLKGLLDDALWKSKKVKTLHDDLAIAEAKLADTGPHTYRLEGDVPLLSYPTMETENVVRANVYEALDAFAEEALAYATSVEGGGYLADDAGVEVMDHYRDDANVYEVFGDGTERRVWSNGKPVGVGLY